MYYQYMTIHSNHACSINYTFFYAIHSINFKGKLMHSANVKKKSSNKKKSLLIKPLSSKSLTQGGRTLPTQSRAGGLSGTLFVFCRDLSQNASSIESGPWFYSGLMYASQQAIIINVAAVTTACPYGFT